MERKQLYGLAVAVAGFLGIGVFLMDLAPILSPHNLALAITTIALAIWCGMRLRSLPERVRQPLTILYAVCITFGATGCVVGSYYYPAHVDTDAAMFMLPTLLFSLSTILWSAKKRLPHASEGVPDMLDARGARIAAAAALIAAAIFILWLFFGISSGYAGNDEGSYLYESALTAHGSMPFRDFISRAPTQIFAFALPLLFAAGTLTTLKIINLAVVSATGLLAYLAIRRYQGMTVSLLAAILVVANPVFFITKLAVNTTTVSIPLMLATLYLIGKESRTADVIAGAALAALVFTREIHALFIIGFLIYLLWRRQYPRLLRICAGGAAIALPVFSFFGSMIGYGPAVGILLGIRHIGVEEPSVPLSYSVSMVEFTLLSCLPFAALFAFLKKKRVPWGPLAPALIWIGTLLAFYGAYSFKRGFMLSYGSEFIPLIAVATFMCISFDRAALRARGALLISLVALALTAWPYSSVRSAYGSSYSLGGQYDLDQLTGSGVPIDNFNEINLNIRAYLRSRSIASGAGTIMAGNLSFASENGLRQFMNLTRPMAYEGDSGVYTIYDAPPLSIISRSFAVDPTDIVVADRHLQSALWDSIKDEVAARYDLIYQDDYAYVYGLKTPPALEERTKK